MTERFRNALSAQNGACNPRPIANALVEAIDECRAEGVDPSEDSAVYLILHQLTYILTGLDVAQRGKYDRWSRATEESERRAEESGK